MTKQCDSFNPHTTRGKNSHFYLHWGPMDPKVLRVSPQEKGAGSGGSFMEVSEVKDTTQLLLLEHSLKMCQDPLDPSR